MSENLKKENNGELESSKSFDKKKFWKIFGISAGLTVDFGATIFFFVISIIMIVKSVTGVKDDPRTLIGYLQLNTTVYLCAFVIPLFVLLAINIVLLVLYVKKSAKKKIEVDELSSDQIDALKAELLNDLKKENSDKKDNE